MADLTIIGSGITGLLISSLYKGNSEIYEEVKNIENLNSNASLWTIIPPLCGKYMEECLDSIKFYEDISKRYGVYSKITYTLTDQKLNGTLLSEDELHELEPNIRLNGEIRKIENSFFIEGEELIKKLVSTNNVFLGKKVISLEVENEEVKYIRFSSNERVSVERLIIAGGYWINELYPINLNPFKGHLIVTSTNYSLNGIIHYKGKIIVKGENNLYINGDSNKDASLEINYNIVRDHLNIVSRIIPISKNVKIRVGIRSVSNDGEPIIKKVFKNTIIVSGFRFGFALAPFLAREALKIIEGM
ncbi:FAD-dependent oxidoreductase [Sulfurisphaera javensis]|uniref:FAD-dependent oxidoreductase n=1 Tax=Sulfurisphaera javensis TaxID=2049879 RepID=A0AAT9GNP7_9CREN